MTTTPLPKFLQKPKPVRRQLGGGGAAPGSADPYARAAFVGELSELAKTPEGERNHRLNVAGFNLAQLCASGHLDRDETWSALYSTALAIGLEPGESANTLRSAFEAGEADPRDVPDQEEVPEVTVLGPRPLNGSPGAQEGGQDGPEEEGQGDEPPSLRARFPALDWAELWADESEEEWIVEPIIPARRLVALFSPPKVGKSLLMLELAVGIARGTAVLGHTPDRPRRVLYVDHENDPRGDVRTRLQAMGLTPAELDGLVYLSYPQMAHLDTWVGGVELLAIAQEYGCELVVIDTISRAVAGEENDNDTWLAFYRNTGRLLKAEGIACVRLDHTGKDLAKGMRGGSAKYGDVDLAWSMTPGPADDLLVLECVANRLPVTEKRLTLKRHAKPLRHEAQDGSAAWRSDQEKAARIADAYGLDPAAGFPAISDAFRELKLYPEKGAPPGSRGRFSKALLESLPGYRRTRPQSFPPEPLDTLLDGLS